MDKYRYCTLCLRRFTSGPALAGHMRAHVAAAFSSPPKPHRRHSSPFGGDAKAEEAEDNKEKLGSGAAYGLRENPRKSFRIVDPEFSSASVVVEDGESEAESPLEAVAASHRRRSKRPRSRSQAPLPESASSVSDVKTEEDVALCLLMLSRDSWPGVKESPLANGRDEADGRRLVARSKPPRRGRIKRRFGLPPVGQLGTRSDYNFEDDADGIAKIHECPFCSRVFASGQALGGHKRSHSTTSATTIIVASLPTSCSQPKALTAAATCGGDFGLIDLNVPAPADEENALSTVSDAEFIPSCKSAA